MASNCSVPEGKFHNMAGHKHSHIQRCTPECPAHSNHFKMVDFAGRDMEINLDSNSGRAVVIFAPIKIDGVDRGGVHTTVEMYDDIVLVDAVYRDGDAR